jgi:ABC-2 type transport system permease protein
VAQWGGAVLRSLFLPEEMNTDVLRDVRTLVFAGAATFVVALMFWIINWFSDSAGPTIGPILTYLSITQHFDDFGKGVIDTKHVIFYLSFIAFGLFLTLKSVDSERWRG